MPTSPRASRAAPHPPLHTATLQQPASPRWDPDEFFEMFVDNNQGVYKVSDRNVVHEVDEVSDHDEVSAMAAEPPQVTAAQRGVTHRLKARKG
eukprot:1680183-Pyramimonas_sp.AAC.1